jgi:hypothetical protein
MPLGKHPDTGSSWVEQAGYRSDRRRQDWLTVIGAAPFVWFFLHRDFASLGFLWAIASLIALPLLAAAWTAMRCRCAVCGLPLYALWLIGFPRGRARTAFDALPCCPYCLDDGTGMTGDRTRVVARKEVMAGVRYLFVAVLLFLALMAIVFILGVVGLLPGYGHVSR